MDYGQVHYGQVHGNHEGRGNGHGFGNTFIPAINLTITSLKHVHYDDFKGRGTNMVGR